MTTLFLAAIQLDPADPASYVTGFGPSAPEARGHMLSVLVSSYDIDAQEAHRIVGLAHTMQVPALPAHISKELFS